MATRGKTKSGGDGEFFDSNWDKMEQAFNDVLELVDSGYKQPPDKTKWISKQMTAYTIVYNLCTRHTESQKGSGTADKLYQRAKAMVENYLTQRIRKVVGAKSEELLTNVYHAWDQHQLVVRWCRVQFRYLDEYYTKQSGIDNLRVMMLKCFHTAVYEKVKDELRTVLLQQIEKEREGGTISREVMKESINLFVEMGMDSLSHYTQDFETAFLQDSSNYYKRKAARWLSEPDGVHTYLLRCEKHLNEEQQRAIAYLHASTLPKVIHAVETELLSNHKSRVLDDPDAGTEALLLNWKVDDLTRMFRMFKRVERGLEPMSAIVRNFIKKEGNEINSKFAGGTLESSKYIDACLELHDKYTELFHGSFEDHEAFNKARREAYEVFMNETLTQPTKQEGQPPVKVTVSELLSLYCDNLMKSTSISSDELDAILQKVVALFVYIQDKDLFQEFYRKQMSKRLLMSKTDNDNEKLLISKLKLKMGAPYTSKLEGMIHDKSVSAETQQKFMTWCKTNQTKTLPFDFSAQVLTTGHWPAFKIEALNAPPMFQEALENFRMYYHSTTSSKVLKWVHSLGTVTMSAKFKKGPKEVICTTYQACVLLLFNDREKCNVKTDMCDVLNLPIAEAKRTIVALAYGKFPMLVKEGGGKKVVNETDDFKVNEEFSTPQRKFKIPSVMQTVGDPIEKTDESRRHVTDASIVRIMKARKQMSHAELQAECLRQLGNLFRPDPKLIKKRIEDLIQRAYLERDQDDRNMYRYLA